MESNLALWIGIAVVVLIVIALVAVVLVGKRRGESKKVSFNQEDTEPKELTQQEKSGNYQAKSGFNFAAGSEPEKQPAGNPNAAGNANAAGMAGVFASAHDEPAKAEQPAPATPAEPAQADSEKVGSEKAANEDTERTESVEDIAAAAVARAKSDELADAPLASEADRAEAAVPTDKAPQAPKAEKVEKAPKAEPTEAGEKTAPATQTADAVSAEPVEPVEPVEPAEQAEPAEPAQPEAADQSAQDETSTAEAEEAAAAADAQTSSAERALEETPVPTPAPAAEEVEQPQPEPEAEPASAEPREEIAPAVGRLGRMRGRLSRSQNAIGQGLMGILSAGDLDDDAWEEIEDTLIMADLGTKSTLKVTESLREKIAERGVSSEDEARAMLREALIEAGHVEMDRSIKAMPHDGKPAVVMVVGVNGTGKTTTTGKLARVLVSLGKKVLLGAADTFRAAAADQLETWGKRVGAETVRGKEGADPASVAFDAVAAGVENQVDVVLVDTAGRLHTSTDLMDQLGKVKRVVEKKSQVDEVLLVIDATVGQNGLVQARIFREVVDITGVVLTKLDGTAKGGIVFQVQEELGVPVKLVGLGEGSDDLAPFEVESFVDALLGS
ncbi:signal recognition particle-docking protein FtsY [Corynebacterium sp. 32222D000AT]|nr:signal recognition particle-docking protein FtsY [Mycobacteriaceae bacterium]MDY5828435.1 signal recognition particle-docking protein FtsY [Corynebacterium sp.]